MNINHLSPLSRYKIIALVENLLPRRREIWEIIQDHSPCSLDFISRRFVTTPHSTLRYDLQQLQKMGLIKKLGTTRGALYQALD